MEKTGWVLHEHEAMWCLETAFDLKATYCEAAMKAANCRENGNMFFVPPAVSYYPLNVNREWKRGMEGAQCCEQWKVDSYIQKGSFGMGYIAHDMASQQKVFIKLFRATTSSSPEAILRRNDSVRAEAEAMLHPLFEHATSHPAVITNRLCYGAVDIPKRPTGKPVPDMFFVQTPDLCSSGELFDLLVLSNLNEFNVVSVWTGEAFAHHEFVSTSRNGGHVCSANAADGSYAWTRVPALSLQDLIRYWCESPGEAADFLGLPAGCVLDMADYQTHLIGTPPCTRLFPQNHFAFSPTVSIL